MRTFPTILVLSIPVLSAAVAFAQRAVDFEGRPATALENDRIELQILNKGGAFASLMLKSGTEKMNPLWNPIRMARETGGDARFGDSIGHFVCVDGFGPTSKEEQAAGYQGHGEAHRQPWERVSATKEGGVTKIKFRATLPIMQEVFTRQVELADGEQVIYVDSELENLLGFDRPANWAEHGTIGAPFLTPEKTVVDASVGRCQVRPHNNQPRHTLTSGREFVYPVAPQMDGTMRSTRTVPANPNSMDHTGCLMDTDRRLVYVTALRPDKRLLIGYLWRRAEYPWLQEWMNYPSSGALARGLEFGTQPYDVSHRETIEMGNLFGMPAFRWLPAKSKIGTRFAMFLTEVPEGFTKVDDVRHEDGKIILEDKKAGKKVELKASLPL
ncbi:MAG: hypothetical protein U0Q16_29895 [Bryobacteraceae bacterium]